MTRNFSCPGERFENDVIQIVKRLPEISLFVSNFVSFMRVNHLFTLIIMQFAILFCFATSLQSVMYNLV